MSQYNMKAERLLLIMIVAAAILVTPSVLTSPILAQVPPGTGTADGTTDTADENQGTTGTTAEDESPSELYQTFQSCLSEAEGTETFATEDEIRDCFIEAGYTGAGDDNQDEEDENEDNNDENENEDDEETN
jgi:hypothetical protein